MSDEEIGRILDRLDDPENGLVAIRTNQRWIKEAVAVQAATFTQLVGEGLERCKMHSKEIARLKKAVGTTTDDNGIEVTTPGGAGVKTHSVWGTVTAVLMLVIVYMFVHNMHQATTNSDDARISRDAVAHEVRSYLKGLAADNVTLLKDSEKTKQTVNRIEAKQ